MLKRTNAFTANVLREKLSAADVEIRSLQTELEAAKEKRRLIEAQHARLCDEVYEEDGETLKIVAERKAHDDLKRSILDGSHPNLVLERRAREEAVRVRNEAIRENNSQRERAEADEQEVMRLKEKYHE